MWENIWCNLTIFIDYHYVIRRRFDLENAPGVLIEHFIDGVFAMTVDSRNIIVSNIPQTKSLPLLVMYSLQFQETQL